MHAQRVDTRIIWGVGHEGLGGGEGAMAGAETAGLHKWLQMHCDKSVCTCSNGCLQHDCQQQLRA
jgi:hypothetical protein